MTKISMSPSWALELKVQPNIFSSTLKFPPIPKNGKQSTIAHSKTHAKITTGALFHFQENNTSAEKEIITYGLSRSK